MLAYGNPEGLVTATSASSTLFKRVFSFLSWCDKIGDLPFKALGISFKFITNSTGALVFQVFRNSKPLVEMIENAIGKFKILGDIVTLNGVKLLGKEITEEELQKMLKGEAFEVIGDGTKHKIFVRSNLLLKIFYETYSQVANKVRLTTSGAVEYYYQKTKAWVKIGQKNGDDFIPDERQTGTIEEAFDDNNGIRCENGQCGIDVGGGCFVAGTKVHTRTGIKKIEEVRENEEVLAFDENKKTTTFARVALAFSLTANYLTKVIVGKDTLTTTPNHPFYVSSEVSEADGAHWLQARSLRKGAMILLASGLLSTVDTAYTYAANEKVYNFEIAEHHNYYVGESGILVHNGNCITAAIKNFLDNHPTAKNWPQAKKDKFLDDFKESPTFVSAFKNGDLDIDAWDVLHTAESAARLSHEALEKLTKLLKNNRFKWTKVEFEKMFTKLNKTIKKGTDVTEIIDGESLTAQAGNMLSEVELLNAIKNLDARYDIGNADALMKELCCESPWKFVGAEMVLRYIEKDGLWDKVKEFEKYVDKRYIDIVLNKGNKTVRVEVKSWIKIYKNTFLKQFAKDLDAVNNLDELLWIFDNKYGINFKNDIKEVLTSPAGIASLKGLKDVTKYKRFFDVQNASDLDEIAMSKFISQNFNKIFGTR